MRTDAKASAARSTLAPRCSSSRAMLLPFGVDPSLDRRADSGTRSMRGDGVSSSRSRWSPGLVGLLQGLPPPAAQRRQALRRRGQERDRGPVGHRHRDEPLPPPTSAARPSKAAFHGPPPAGRTPASAAPTDSPCVTLRTRSRTSSGSCGSPLNQTSPTIARAAGSRSSGTMPPMWSLSMWVTTATSTTCPSAARRPGGPAAAARCPGSAVDEQPPRIAAVAKALDEQAVPEPGGEQLDADRVPGNRSSVIVRPRHMTPGNAAREGGFRDGVGVSRGGSKRSRLNVAAAGMRGTARSG